MQQQTSATPQELGDLSQASFHSGSPLLPVPSSYSTCVQTQSDD